VRLLLTSAGITNPTVRAALLDLLGRPIEACSALVIAAASYPLRRGPRLTWKFIVGEEPQTPMAELGGAP
jgi:dipeptidase E